MSVARVALLCAVAGLPCTAAAQGRELTPAEQAAHVVSRLTFGARPGDVDGVLRIGVDRWIAQQLQPESIANDAAEEAVSVFPHWTRPTNALAELNTPVAIRVSSEMMTVDSATGRRTINQAALARLAFGRAPTGPFSAGKLVLAQTSERALYEVMSDFWENHFSVFSGKLPSPDAIIVLSRDAIRPNALGKFRTLLGAVARSPAMLFYLDNALSGRDSLNENYARELLELHTLGVDGGYTQDDVVNVARAFTGWSATPSQLRDRARTQSMFSFQALRHDTSAKVVLGNRLPPGRGMEDATDVLDILARHPSTARYISWKLARRFVSDSPPPALVERAAATFLQTDGDIREVVRVLVTSDEFFSRAAFRAKVKTPLEFVVSARRALDARPDSTVDTSARIGNLGQPLYGRASPDGWPDDAAAWINSGTLFNRFLFAGDVAADRVAGVDLTRWREWNALVTADAATQADGVVRSLLGGVASPGTREHLRAIETAHPEERLREMIAMAIGSPDFQRR